MAFEPGDIILLRTGWYRWYSGLTPDEKQALDTTDGKESQRDIDNVVLDRHMTTAAWLWDHLNRPGFDRDSLHRVRGDRPVRPQNRITSSGLPFVAVMDPR